MSSIPAPIVEDVSTVIGSLSQNDQVFRLTRQYKGVTLAQEARLVEVTPDSATLQTTRSERFPWLDGDIHLHNPALPRPVAARMHYLNLEQGVLLISDLAYADWKSRRSDRVQPQKPTYVNISFRKNLYRALLEDLSIDGIGILANRNIDPESRLKVGSKLTLNFRLPPDHTFSSLKGMLVYRQRVGLALVKFGVHLFPNESQRHALQEIVSQRREEIMQELDQVYFLAHEPQRVENLYF